MKSKNELERRGRLLNPPYQMVFLVARNKVQANTRVSRNKSRS
jgi:hypothetical protein